MCREPQKIKSTKYKLDISKIERYYDLRSFLNMLFSARFHNRFITNRPKKLLFSYFYPSIMFFKNSNKNENFVRQYVSQFAMLFLFYQTDFLGDFIAISLLFLTKSQQLWIWTFIMNFSFHSWGLFLSFFGWERFKKIFENWVSRFVCKFLNYVCI